VHAAKVSGVSFQSSGMDGLAHTEHFGNQPFFDIEIAVLWNVLQDAGVTDIDVSGPSQRVFVSISRVERDGQVSLTVTVCTYQFLDAWRIHGIGRKDHEQRFAITVSGITNASSGTGSEWFVQKLQFDDTLDIYGLSQQWSVAVGTDYRLVDPLFGQRKQESFERGLAEDGP
jgi:hypothetical protein